MKISIALATYNGEKFLQQQLDSFSKQTRLPDELIISDDCSTDTTVDIINRYAEVAPFEVILLKNEKNLGFGENFCNALNHTSGDLIFLSDQDDYWFPEKIETMIGWIDENPDCVIYMCDAAIADEKLHTTGVTKISQLRSAGISLENYVMGSVSMIKRTYLSKCLPLPAGVLAHDTWLIYISDALEKKNVREITLQLYRRHDSNVSKSAVNSTVQITKRMLRKRRILRKLKHINSNFLEYKITKREPYVKGYENILNRFEGEDYLKLHNFLQIRKQELSLLKERALIHRYPFTRRFYAIAKLYKARKTRKDYSLKTALRDLFG